MGSITCDLNDLFEETVMQENKFSGRVFDVFVKKVKCPDGQMAEREVVMHNGGAAILAVDEDLNCHMISQFRSPIEEVLLEVPAGKIEPGENPLTCAAREIVEETGFEAGKMDYVGFSLSSPGYCSEKIYLYIATDLKKTEGDPDESEFLMNKLVPLKELVDMCDRGEITDSKTQILVYKAARRFL